MRDRSRRDVAGKRVVAHALGFLGANLLIAPPCLLGLATGHGSRPGILLPSVLAVMALGIVTLRAAVRLLDR